jgi:hypothetical protein
MAAVFVVLATLAAGLAATVALAPPASAASTLNSGKILASGQVLYSPNGQFMLKMQPDGNLVLYSWRTDGRALWWSGTSNHPGAYLKMQPDGNLVIYPAGGGAALWATWTGPGTMHLTMQDDGNIVEYNGSTPVWNSTSQMCTETGKDNCDRTTWAVAFLSTWEGLADPETDANIYAIESWERAEGTGGQCNALNTGQIEPGSWTYNGDGVQNYQDYNGVSCWEWGTRANLAAIRNTNPNYHYAAILAVLANPVSDRVAQCDAFSDAVRASSWGTTLFTHAVCG